MHALKNLPSFSTLLTESLSIYTKKFHIFLPIITFYFVLSLFDSFITTQVYLRFLIIISFYLTTFLTSRIILIAANKLDPTPTSILQGWEKNLPFFIVTILVTYAAVSGIFFLLIPGILISVMTSFADYTLLLEGKNINESIYTSRNLTRGYFWQIFGRITIILFPSLLFILLALWLQHSFPIFSSIFVALTSSLYLPLVTIFCYQLYSQVKAIKGPVPGTASKKFKFFFWFLATLGIALYLGTSLIR